MPMKRSLQELLTVDEPAWPQVENWVSESRIPVELLVPDEQQQQRALLETQVTLRSPMGAVVYHSGGAVNRSSVAATPWVRLSETSSLVSYLESSAFRYCRRAVVGILAYG
jgi:hypothetical protein